MKEDTEITLETLAQMVARGFESVHEELGGIKTDVAVLKEGVSGLKENVAVLKEDVSGLKENVAVLKTDVVALKEDVAVLKEDVAVLHEDVQELTITVNRIDTRTQNQVDAVYHDTHALTERVEILEKR